MIPIVDLVILSRHDGPLDPEVELGIRNQRDVQLVVHRIVGATKSGDNCRWDAIARARNEGKSSGASPWLMFLDDDVILEPRCISALIDELGRRPIYAALAADYLGEGRVGEIACHVSMGATLFRREVLDQLRFTSRDGKCECQCCCDDLRRLHWGIDYCQAALARHLPKPDVESEARKVPALCCTPDVGSECVTDRSAPSAVPSVCIVVCYFGPLPGWIELLLDELCLQSND